MDKLFGAYDIKTGEKGQTLVEFALIVLLLITLMFGLMEFARAWQYSNALTNGVRDGARFASRLDNNTGFQSKVRNYTFSQITSAIPRDTMVATDIVVYKNTTSLDLLPPNPNFVAGDTVTVEASYDFVILTGSIIESFSGTRQLTRQATMRYE